MKEDNDNEEEMVKDSDDRNGLGFQDDDSYHMCLKPNIHLDCEEPNFKVH